jgi:hypothetical protein
MPYLLAQTFSSTHTSSFGIVCDKKNANSKMQLILFKALLFGPSYTPSREERHAQSASFPTGCMETQSSGTPQHQIKAAASGVCLGQCHCTTWTQGIFGALRGNPGAFAGSESGRSQEAFHGPKTNPHASGDVVSSKCLGLSQQREQMSENCGGDTPQDV